MRFPLVFFSCYDKQYSDSLPTVGIVIPFHNEWPSVLLRTIQSIIDRTPKHLLKEIVLVDDDSNLRKIFYTFSHLLLLLLILLLLLLLVLFSFFLNNMYYYYYYYYVLIFTIFI